MWEPNGKYQANSTVAGREHIIGSRLESVHSPYIAEPKTAGADMKNIGQGSEPVLYKFFISVILLILSLEWIYPVTSSGQQGSERFLSVMAGLTGALLLAGLLRTGWIAGILIRLFIALAALGWMYGGSDPAGWAVTYPSTLAADMGSFIHTWRFHSISVETRGLLMMCGWSMLITSVQSLVLLRRSVMLFGSATLVYLLLLESFAGLDVYASVVRSVLWILLIQAMLQLLRLNGGVTTPIYRRSPYVLWSAVTLAVSAFMVLFSAIPGQLASIPPPERISLEQMGMRLARWAGYTQDASIPAATAVTGYSTADAPMGAPLVQGDSIFFEAKSPEATYWRGETRSYYNGSTWSDPAQRFETASPSGLVRTDGWENPTYWQRIRQTVTMKREWRGPNPLFTGGMPLNLSLLDKNNDNQKNKRLLLSNEDSATLWLAGSSDNRPVKSYTADVMIPVATAEQLRLLGKSSRMKDPAAIRRTYLQLPTTLPGRVQVLAKEIIQGSESRYDAVQAVKTYLADHAEYTLDTRMPPRGTDFVDDFLFVTRQGYCNHFSTAMIVLLRAEGIPARWVKGFGPGEVDPTVSGRYIVTQGDAHSWVEVYFPGAGWMPFEATPGFTMTQGEGQDAAALSGQHPVAVTPPLTDGGAAHAGAWLLARARALAAHPWLAAALAAAALLCAAVALRMRRLRPALRLRLLLAWPRSSFPDRERLLSAAAPVWAALARRYGPRPPGMTLREYAASPAVAAGTDGADIARFAADWERLLYGPDRPLRADSLDFLRRALHLARRMQAL
ncbi:transglutaminase domain-containing protein [Paenibacillus sp. JNUCC31]|uniref:transglutaminase TgpA family protein n=1 Tax=Paenibacillus sp. JNUCC-31 TaxID=2777983 RepID=UPI00177E88BB|nr:transglutaminase domain-containing protein [Paenibacillus sp. JNUCC-31]QOS76832.1 transglutaminase domain-containing protein [Paenibacillus sp. JNUCC-31]